MSNQRTAPIPIDQARSRLLASIDAISVTEIVSLDDACGRIVAENIISLIDLPRTHNAAVDGYGVNSADLAAAPHKLFKTVSYTHLTLPTKRIV